MVKNDFMKKHFFYLILITAFLVVLPFCKNKDKSQMFFAGGFTEGKEKGMALIELKGDGQMEMIRQFDAGPSPSFFCFSKRHNLIYALDEVMEFKGRKGAAITTLKYDPAKGTLEKKGEMTVPYGGACHISITRDSGFLLIANYSSSSVAVVKLDNDGLPGKVTDSILYVTEPPVVSHPHMISEDPAGKHVYLADLGLDRVVIFDLDRNTGKLLPLQDGIINLPDSCGPRHFIFNKDGSMFYLINELGSTIMAFRVDANGILHHIATYSTLKESFTGKNSCAEILIGKDEKFLYGSNRGDNSIVVFRINEDGSLKLSGHSTCGGNWPRGFVIDPSGEYLITANQRSDDVCSFKINMRTGLPEGPLAKVSMKAPAYLEFRK